MLTTCSSGVKLKVRLQEHPVHQQSSYSAIGTGESQIEYVMEHVEERERYVEVTHGLTLVEVRRERAGKQWHIFDADALVLRSIPQLRLMNDVRKT